ncbi:hypothetical protein BFW01_g11022 [Lasiodiplodia theobromae]|uniref:Uncharacterized protein n=1 Tax=Lasiodiplodia theobromae TaxID=45133 RepID=A0A8H7IPV4_9PEZI|nr:hypothetical protein BFW01_g11022 [Lasiodiplodia theobromae]
MNNQPNDLPFGDLHGHVDATDWPPFDMDSAFPADPGLTSGLGGEDPYDATTVRASNVGAAQAAFAMNPDTTLQPPLASLPWAGAIDAVEDMPGHGEQEIPGIVPTASFAVDTWQPAYGHAQRPDYPGDFGDPWSWVGADFTGRIQQQDAIPRLERSMQSDPAAYHPEQWVAAPPHLGSSAVELGPFW